MANNLRVNENRIFTNDLVYDMVCGIMGAINNEYDTVYDISSLHYGLTWDKAVSKNGDVKIQEDPTTSK